MEEYPEIRIWEWEGYNLNIYGGHSYSGFPQTTNKGLQPAMHMTNWYIRYVTQRDHQPVLFSNFIESAAGGLMHEFGHYFNLRHKGGDNMNGSGGSNRNSLSCCQIETMWNSLMTTNLRQIVSCDDANMYNLTVTEDQIWRNDLNIYGNVTVENGATLTITCNLHFSSNRKIIVKSGSHLIIDGALLSSMNSCSEKWQGITIEGGHGEGMDIIVKNEATIENARTAVSMNPSSIPWPERTNFGNGTILAENSFFTNNKRDIEFIAYNQHKIQV